MENGWVKREIFDSIMDAIAADDDSTHVFEIISDGGDGKTILLRQIGMALGSPDGIGPAEGWSGIIDLYHSELHSSSSVESALAAVFGQGGEFDKFELEQSSVSDLKGTGAPGGEIEKVRAELSGLFAQAMNLVAVRCRPVIAFDTTERTQYEIDDLQKAAHIENENTAVRTWLAEQLEKWQNCVVLLVGRPTESSLLTPALRQALRKKRGVHLHEIKLGGFTPAEAERYFQKWDAFPSPNDFTAQFYARLNEATGGNPVRLEIAYEIARDGFGVEELVRHVMNGAMEKLGTTIDKTLITIFMESPERPDAWRKVIKYLVVARKGLTAELLAYLDGSGDMAACQALLDDIARISFIKRRPLDNSYYLHDALYDVCDRELITVAEAQQYSRRIVKWYESRLQESTPGDPHAQDLLVNSLFYRLRADVEDGYDWYLRHDDDAIRSVETDMDMRLRNELIAFLKSPSMIDQKILETYKLLPDALVADTSAAWVKRLLYRGNSTRALEASNSFKTQRPPQAAPATKTLLGWSEFDVYTAQAHIYVGNQPGEAVNLLKGIIDAQWLTPRHADGRYWRTNLVRGRARNNLGYVYWMPLGHLDASLLEFGLARSYFTTADLPEELANTLDNMARVYTINSHETRAETLAEDALAIRKREGRKYREALSLNSYAIVLLEFGRPDRAEGFAREALGICEHLKVQRGIGLASITLGHTLRLLGNLSEMHTFSTSRSYFSQSVSLLNRAIEIFADGRVVEPVRLAEAYNQLGSTYRDWARLAQKQPTQDSQQLTFERAVRALKSSIAIAEENGFTALYADSCEDLAGTYLAMGRSGDAVEWLDRGAGSIPEEYKMHKGESAGTPLEKHNSIEVNERMELNWLMLGKIELTRAEIENDRKPDDDDTPERVAWLRRMAEHYILAGYYFECFSDQAKRIKDTYRRVYHAFKTCSSEEKQLIGKEMLPSIAAEYGIDFTRLGKFYADTLAVVLE